MTGSGRRRLRRVLLFLLLIAVVTSAVYYYFALRATHEAIAELRVHPYSSLDPEAIPTLARDQSAELEQFAATCTRLVRSNRVLSAALRDEDVKSLQLIKDCDDPLSWLHDAIEVRHSTPAVIEIVITCRGSADSEDCVNVVNAVANRFVEEAAVASQEALRSRKDVLTKIHDDLCEELARNRTTLDDLVAALGAAAIEQTSEVAMHPALISKTEKMIDALAEEMASIRVSLLVDDDVDEEGQTSKLERLEREYTRQTAELEELLAEQAAKARPQNIDVIERKRRDISRLEQQIDRLAELLFQTDMALESRDRVELISEAVSVAR